MRFLRQLLVLAVLCLGGAASAFALPTISISSSGNGVFVLHARELQSIAGLKVIVNYDSATLANPRVGKGPLGAGATMWLPNASIPGSVVVTLAKEQGLPASGVIATITFDVAASPPGIIRSLQAQVSNVAGALVQYRTENPFWRVQNEEGLTDTKEGATQQGETSGSTDTTISTKTTLAGSGQSSSSTTTGGGAAPLQPDATPPAPSEEQAAAAPEAPAETTAEGSRQRSEDQPAEPSESASGGVGTQARAGATADDVQPLESLVREEKLSSPAGYQSVLEQLRGFTGPKSPKSLTEIFSRHSTPGVRQEPAIGLTDGSTKLRLLVTPHSAGGKAPNFSLSGAQLLALRPGPDGSWVVEVLPAKGSYSATLTIVQGKVETVIPLLVAPPLAGGEQPKLTESAFAQFLSERGTEKSPHFDLNGDGRRDYIDDYIFSANYLARKGTGPGKEDSRRAVTVGGSGDPGAEGPGKAK